MTHTDQCSSQYLELAYGYNIVLILKSGVKSSMDLIEAQSRPHLNIYWGDLLR